MKNGVRAWLPLVVVAAAMLVLPASAFAYVTTSPYHLKYGVGAYGASDQHYFVASSASTCETAIDNARYDWVYTTARLGITTPISYTQTTVQSNSRMDFHYGTYHPESSGITGDTSFYNGSTAVGGYLGGGDPSVDWVWSKIRLNNPNFKSLSAFNEEGTAAHEMGHGMGMKHTSATNQVMCQLGAGRTVNNAQADDLAGINYLY